MAQPSDTNETFLREVDENLRRDQMRDFFRRYSNWLIAGVVLFLAASGGFIWWQQHQVERSAADVEKLAQAYKEIGSGASGQASRQLDELANSNSKGVQATTQFTRAALAIQQNDTKSAIAIYSSMAQDRSLPGAFRDAALVRQTALEFDQLQPQQVVARLEPLTKPGEPWFGSAGEMTAMALLKQGKKSEAGPLLVAIAKDNSVPETLRARARQLAGSLGFDAGPAIQPQAQ